MHKIYLSHLQPSFWQRIRFISRPAEVELHPIHHSLKCTVLGLECSGSWHTRKRATKSIRNVHTVPDGHVAGAKRPPLKQLTRIGHFHLQQRFKNGLNIRSRHR